MIKNGEAIFPKVGMVHIGSYHEESVGKFAFHTMYCIFSYPHVNGYALMDENDARFFADLFLYNINTQRDNHVFKYS